MIQFVRLILITLLFLTQSVYAVQTIDSQSGLLIDKGYKVVEQHCSICHSLTLVIQNRASRQGWINTIRWMQQTQGMALLNKQDEKVILDYLAKNYAPNKTSRRMPIVTKGWHKF